MNAPAIRHPAIGMEAVARYDAMLARWNGNGRTYETVEAYWRDPAPFDAEQARERAIINARHDARRDAGLLRRDINEALETMVLEWME
ncbi:MAG: hypothetical protein ACKVOB_13320 [Sphingomonas sp.]